MERRRSALAGLRRGRGALPVAVLLSGACWLGAASDARAAGSFVVDGANPGCSDTAAGAGTEGNPPYCTINAAAAARGGPGTTILVNPGIYREAVGVLASGAEGSPFVFKALGAGVVLDGADNFSSPALWTPATGTVYLAATVTWGRGQVFVDGARLTEAPAAVAPADLPPGSFRHVLGEGLYVNLGGDNPGTHQTLVGRRNYGFFLGSHSWVTIDGFTVTRFGCTGIYANDSSPPSTNLTVTHNTVTFANCYGIYVSGFTNVLVGSNVVSDAGLPGIILFRGQNSSIQDNEVFRSGIGSPNAYGIRLSGSSDSLLQRNTVHHNGGTGIRIDSSSNTLSLQNRSWHNGSHGFHLSQAAGTRHVGDVAWGNAGRGFSLGWEATDTHIFNSIGVNNGLTTGEYDLFVDRSATPGFASNYNLFWNRTSQAPIKYAGTKYTTLAAFTAATGHDADSIQADPRFVNPAGGDFRLLPGSPAIDAADSSVPDWPATDAAGQARVDDPATANTGTGPVPYADRGALEFVPSGAPVAALTVTPASGPAPLAVMLDASGSTAAEGTIAAYAFDPGDGSALIGPQPDATAPHSYVTPGTYTATVTVTDTAGATGTASATVTVADNQAPNGTIDTPAANVTIMAGQGVRFTGTGTDPDGHPLTFLWTFGGGAPNATVKDPGAVIFSTPGTYTVTLTVTDSLGAADPTPDSRVITVNGSNLVGNPSFESNTGGWAPYPGSTTLIQRVTGGIEGGAFALEVRRPVGSTGQFGINDSPNWVAKTPAAGTRYHFSAWVRSEASTSPVRLRVREYLNGVQVGGATHSAPGTLSPAWRLVLVDHVTQAAGSTLDFQVLSDALTATGEVFQTDNIAIVIIP